jgi:hypothetical protein
LFLFSYHFYPRDRFTRTRHDIRLTGERVDLTDGVATTTFLVFFFFFQQPQIVSYARVYNAQWRSKGRANCTYARGAKLRESRIFVLQSIRNLKYVDVVYFYTLRVNSMMKL